jgi:hypothetical protein
MHMSSNKSVQPQIGGVILQRGIFLLKLSVADPPRVWEGGYSTCIV